MTDTGKQESEQDDNVSNKIKKEEKISTMHPEGAQKLDIDTTDERSDPEIDEQLHFEDERKVDTENETKEHHAKDSKKRDRNMVEFDDQRRILKSEPVGNHGNRKEKLNKVRIEFQKRILTKLGFFNSVRAQEKKWGVKKDLRKSRMDTQTAG